MWLSVDDVHAKIRLCFPLSRVYFVSCLTGSAAYLCARVVRVSQIELALSFYTSCHEKTARSLPLSVSYSLDSSNQYTRGITLAIFPASLTNCCVNFSRIFFRASALSSSMLSFQPLLEAQDFHTFSSGFVLCWVFSFLALSFKRWIQKTSKLFPNLSAILFCGTFANYLSINLMSTFCTIWE